MVGLDVARALRDAGLRWSPAKGDRFLVPDRDLDDQVFVVSDMVIDVVDVPHGRRILAFNGTTEWALDNIEAETCVWVPREDQLRDLLGRAFVALERLPDPTGGPAGDEPSGGHAVTIEVSGTRSRHVDVDAESAYARALLALLVR
jgi:hypothetical protein